MTNDTPDPAGHGIDRREAIRRAALLSGITLSPSWLAWLDRPVAGAQGSHLSAGQAALVSAIADRLLPRTETPGALDVGVPAFIDILYGEFLDPEERRLLIGGLDMVDASSHGAAGAPFVALDPGRQDAILREIAGRADAGAQASFRLLRAVTVLGYFTSADVGRTVLHYDPVPGSYDACVPLDDVGNRNWTT